LLRLKTVKLLKLIDLFVNIKTIIKGFTDMGC